MAKPTERPIAFLFLGETLLIPHLFPILEAMARLDPGQSLEAWTATETHETLLGQWLTANAPTPVRLRRAPGWRRTDDPARGINPRLPSKLPMLARLAPKLVRARAVVCAEQTSLWLPRVWPWLPPFVKTSHGVGTMSNRDDPRRRAAALILVPSERERTTYLERGFDPGRVIATGYVKSGFGRLAAARPSFAQERPIVLYNPHWQRHRSSWWEWGEKTIEAILATQRYNLIFAPHQRLVEGVPGLSTLCARLNHRDDALCDLDSFAAVDGSYPHAANMYLGDTSSQMLEFIQRPRPAVFLDPQSRDWRADPSLALWRNGPVITDLARLVETLDASSLGHVDYAPIQREFAAQWLGRTDGSGPRRAAEEIARFVNGAG